MRDGDHSIDEERADLEARFRELEAEEQVDRLRRGGAERSDPTTDPLAQMKARFESDGPASSFLLVVCPHCEAKNRTSLSRLRQADPVCGACGRSLASEKIAPGVRR